MGLRLRHTSLFLTYVLAPLCAISNFNYEQVNPRNSPAPCLALCSNQRTCISNGQADGEMLACIHKARR